MRAVAICLAPYMSGECRSWPGLGKAGGCLNPADMNGAPARNASLHACRITCPDPRILPTLDVSPFIPTLIPQDAQQDPGHPRLVHVPCCRRRRPWTLLWRGTVWRRGSWLSCTSGWALLPGRSWLVRPRRRPTQRSAESRTGGEALPSLLSPLSSFFS